MIRFFWKLWLKLTGWNTDVAFPLHLKKMIIIVGPHTSNWDFIMGLAYRSVCRIGNSHFLGKSELFKKPFGWFFKWLGGTPVDRKSKHNVVDQVADLFKKNDAYVLALAPEGTRKKVEQLRTGFYYIAKAANVPIVMAGMDYSKKELIVSDPFYPTDDEKADFLHIIKFFAPIKGKHPELGIAHLLPDSE